jgi:hypothetical protein
MTDPVDFNEKRKQKAKRCEICGDLQHEFVGQCKRIAAITQEPDGGETFHLFPLPDEPPDAA